MASLCARSGARRMWEAERYKTPSSSNRMKIKALRLGPKRLLHGIISCRSAGLGADVGPGQGLGLTTQYKGERPCVLLNATPERGPSPLFQPPPQSTTHTHPRMALNIGEMCKIRSDAVGISTGDAYSVIRTHRTREQEVCPVSTLAVWRSYITQFSFTRVCN